LNEINFNDSTINDNRFYLCKPNREPIAELHFTLNEKIVMNYGGVNELQLSVPYIITTDTGESKRNPTVDLIIGDYLVRHDFRGRTVDYYIITNPNDEGSEDNKKSRSIVCHQLHYEWRNKLVRIVKGTKTLYDPVGNKGILNETLLTKTDWTIDYVDSSLATKYRTFEDTEKNLLEFVFEVIEKYGSYIPVVDTVNKRLSIYLDENYGQDEGLTIEYGKYLKSINGKENFDDVVTRLYVYGKDDLTFRSINPSGADYLESLDYYMYPYMQDSGGKAIQHSRYLSNELCAAIIKHNKLLDQKSAEFKLLLEKEGLQREPLRKKEKELFDLETELLYLKSEKDTLIGTGENLDKINKDITDKETEINNKKNEITTIKSIINHIGNQMNALKISISIEKNFTSAQIKERNLFIRESVWRDANYTSVEDLYNQGKKVLFEKSQPQVVYEVSSVDILNQLNHKHDRDKLKLGSLVTIKYPELGINIQAKIIVIDHDIRNNSLSLTIANTKDIKSGFFKMKDLLQRSANTSTQVDMSKYKWDKSEENNTEIDKILNNAWNANKNAIEGGDNLQYILDRRGLTIKDPKDPDKFLRAVNSVLAITNDGGNTYKNAITSKGLIGETIVGKVLAGGELTIENESGTVTINKDGLTVKQMDLTLTRARDNINNGINSRIVMNAKDGIKIQSSSNNGVTWNDKLYADTTGNLVMAGNISIGTGNAVFKADENGIYSGNSTFANALFSVTPQGFLKATHGSFEGNITAKGTITGGTYKNGEIIGSSIDVNNGVFKVKTDGSMIATNGTFSGNISSTSITGTNITGGNITGSKIQTGESGQRIVLDTQGLRAYDSTGMMRIQIESHPNLGYNQLQFRGQDGINYGVVSATNRRFNVTAGQGADMIFGAPGQGIYFDSSTEVVNFQGVRVERFSQSNVEGLPSKLSNIDSAIANKSDVADAATSMAFDPTTRNLKLYNKAGVQIGSSVNIPK